MFVDKQKIQERVKKAANLLDIKQPGWYNKINLITLNMERGKNCILGQLYGMFMFAPLYMKRLAAFCGHLRLSYAYQAVWVKEIQKRLD